MTPRHYNRVDNGTRSRTYTHLEQRRGPRVASHPMPALPSPFKCLGDCHYTLSFDDIIATLYYSRTEALWTVRFSRPGIVAGSYNQFPRDIPGQEMQHKIIAAIMARRKSTDDWMTDNLPAGEQQGESVPGCYGIGVGEY